MDEKGAVPVYLGLQKLTPKEIDLEPVFTKIFHEKWVRQVADRIVFKSMKSGNNEILDANSNAVEYGW